MNIARIIVIALVGLIGHAAHAHDDAPERIVEAAIASQWMEADIYTATGLVNVPIIAGDALRLVLDDAGELNVAPEEYCRGCSQRTLRPGVYWVLNDLWVASPEVRATATDPVQFPAGLLVVDPQVGVGCRVECGAGYFACCWVNSRTGAMLCRCKANHLDDAECAGGGKGSTSCEQHAGAVTLIRAGGHWEPAE